ncbi:alpha/beta hydrolase [Noviherbaspirillum saxi]|uniref:Alpha/beta hydrolase n=1 Tax=Noviherbaspirillum saxi TaxID=2320863 RepID=A0A3A3FLX2_9BURK|nr:alpha/beta hydrolase [Noviherbaspirillum saxi]RJF92355.1 alpha/beta hydrolase [Noviherbaspirillum saxi]
MNNAMLEIEKFKAAWVAQALEQAKSPPSLDDQRRSFDALMGAVPIADNCEVSSITSGGVRGEIIVPRDADLSKALVYHHGGGFTFGSVLSHRHLVSRLAKAAGVVAYNMEYRLAPETPYPGAIEDALQTYHFMKTEGFAPCRMVFAGESAGGNLTASLLLKIRELGLEQPAGAYLLSPWLDLTQSGDTYQERAAYDPMLTRPALDFCSQAYRAGKDATDPMISPLNAQLSGLPSMFIQVGTDEVLLSDSLEFARRAALAGLDVRLHVWQDMVHAWPLFHTSLPSAGLAAIDEAGAWIAERLRER